MSAEWRHNLCRVGIEMEVTTASELAEQIRIERGSEGLSAEAARSAIWHRIGPKGEVNLSPAMANGADVLGDAYEALISPADRRKLGQFQTPFDVADLMAGWLASEKIETLLDPAVGSGRLLFRSPGAGAMPERMIGFDIDPLAIAMATTNLRSRGLHADFFQADFLTDDDAVRASGLVANPPDAVIANPPFCRHQELSAAQKELLHVRTLERTGLQLSRRTGLHAFFLLRALELARDDARLAFITPSGWLDVSYGLPVKDYLARTVWVESMVVFEPNHLVFPKATTTATIFFIRKRESSGQPTRVVRAIRQAGPAEILEAVNGGDTTLSTSLVDLGTQEADSKRPRQGRRRGGGTALQEVARVRRGIATGNNGFFVISEARRRKWEIDELSLRRCLARPQMFPVDVITESTLEDLGDGCQRWILSSPHADHEKRRDGLGEYLRWGLDEAGANQSYLARNRGVWHQPEERDSCAILVPCINRKQPRFIWNQTGAVALNSFHIIEPHDDADVERIWSTLNSRRCVTQLQSLARPYGGGMLKLEPKALKQLRLVFR